MKKIFIFFLFGLLLMLYTGCTSSTLPSLFGRPGNPANMHTWSPPNEKQLQFRRDNQKRLDAIGRRIEMLFLINEDIAREEETLLASIRSFDPRLGSMEAQVRKKIETVRLNFDQMEAELAKAKVSNKDIEAAVTRLKNYKPPKKFTANQYLVAIEFFKKGQYKKSIDHFQKMLKGKPPHFLLDNIHFGIGSAYYKLNQFENAAKQFQIITGKYPTGDKWPASYVMLGLVYNSLNEKSKAIYLIENALEMNLQEQSRRILQRLLTVIQDENNEEE